MFDNTEDKAIAKIEPYATCTEFHEAAWTATPCEALIMTQFIDLGDGLGFRPEIEILPSKVHAEKYVEQKARELMALEKLAPGETLHYVGHKYTRITTRPKEVEDLPHFFYDHATDKTQAVDLLVPVIERRDESGQLTRVMTAHDRLKPIGKEGYCFALHQPFEIEWYVGADIDALTGRPAFER